MAWPALVGRPDIIRRELLAPAGSLRQRVVVLNRAAFELGSLVAARERTEPHLLQLPEDSAHNQRIVAAN